MISGMTDTDSSPDALELIDVMVEGRMPRERA
jgi:hypothetical protein